MITTDKNIIDKCADILSHNGTDKYSRRTINFMILRACFDGDLKMLRDIDSVIDVDYSTVIYCDNVIISDLIDNNKYDIIDWLLQYHSPPRNTSIYVRLSSR